MSLVRVVLLDVDGTLVDSNDGHAQAWVEALEEAGFSVPFEQVRRLIGKGGDKLLPEVTGLRDDEPRGAAIAERRGELFRARHLPKVVPFDGARALIERMHAGCLSTIVATSAKRDELDGLLAAGGLRELLQKKTTSSDAKESKPDPDIIAAALRRAGARADDAIMIGDTPYDIEAAARAGVPTIAFRCGGAWSDRELRGALAIYDGPRALLDAFDVSLLGS